MSHASDTLQPADTWRTHAACRTEDPDLFFPLGETGPSAAQAEAAKAVCRRCPVRETCLQWALDHRQDHGVWGGTTDRERINMRRRENRAATPEPTTPRPTQPVRPRTSTGPTGPLRRAFEARTMPLADGHIHWTGTRSLTVNNQCYSPNQLAWQLTHDLPPVGNIMRDCDHPGCVAHLTDQADRDERRAQHRQVAA